MMKPRALVLTLGLLLAAGLVLFSDPAPQSDVAEAIVRKPGAAKTASPASPIAAVTTSSSLANNANNARNKKASAAEVVSINSLIDREDLLASDDADKPKAKPCAPATPAMPATAAMPANAAQASKAAKAAKTLPCLAAASGEALFDAQNWTPPPPPPPPPAPPPPPTAPPLPYTYIGKKLQDGKWEVYLAKGDKMEIVTDNMTLGGVYRIDKITPPTLSLTYLPLKQQQTIHIGGND